MYPKRGKCHPCACRAVGAPQDSSRMLMQGIGKESIDSCPSYACVYGAYG